MYICSGTRVCFSSPGSVLKYWNRKVWRTAWQFVYGRGQKSAEGWEIEDPMMLQLLNLLYFQISIINNTGGDQGETWSQFGSPRIVSDDLLWPLASFGGIRVNISANKARLERINWRWRKEISGMPEETPQVALRLGPRNPWNSVKPLKPWNPATQLEH